MSVVVVTPPADPLLGLDLVKQHLRVDGDGDDALIGAYIDAACAHIDGPGGWLGRAIGVQTLELRTHCFGWPGLALPYPPLISVESVKYIDSEGAEQTADPGVYTYAADALRLTYNSTWPTSRLEADAVRVRYVAGYAEDATAETLVTAVPPAIRAALLLMVGDLYLNRETTAEGQVGAVPMSTTVHALLNPFRVWSV